MKRIEDLPQLAPFDRHNKALLDNVHPRDWKNPEPRNLYDLVVIGAGAAGLVSAAGAAGLGARVALIERELLGGDCLNVGCVPSKGVLRAARAWHAVKTAREFGAPIVSATEQGNFAQAMERMRRLRAEISPADSAQRFSSQLGVDVFFGHGRFVGATTIEVAGVTLHFKKAVIAAGARASVPEIPGLADVPYRTNETIFSLETLPRHLFVIGAGPIGCEMAQAFAHLGSSVHLLGRGETILPREDADAAQIVQKSLERDGVKLLTQSRVTRVTREGAQIEVEWTCGTRTERTRVNQLLVATGRTPNTDAMNLEAAGVAYDAHGVKVDDRLRTTNPKIFACGDVCSTQRFTHLADAQARIVIQNALFFGRARASDLVVPHVTYTSPELAHVGISEQEARARAVAIDTLTIPMHEVDRARLDGESEGMLRVHLARGTDRILGATLVAEHAGEMIGELCLAITAKIGLAQIAKTIHPYPTQAEVIKKAADAWSRTRLTPTAKKLFDFYFRLWR